VPKDILQRIGELKSINITETELNVGIDDKFRETKDFTTQMESISETRLLALLRSQSPEDIVNRKEAREYESSLLNRLQVHVIIKVKIIQILREFHEGLYSADDTRSYLAMNQEIEHVVTLPANLQTGFNPI